MSRLLQLRFVLFLISATILTVQMPIVLILGGLAGKYRPGKPVAQLPGLVAARRLGDQSQRPEATRARLGARSG